MHALSRVREFKLLLFALALVFVGVQVAMAMQDTSAQSVQQGAAQVSTEIKTGEVIYVSGNDLVVRVDDGQVKHIEVPDDFKFQVDGKELSVHELTPGMHLTRTVTTTSTPRTVKTVRTIKGTVWHVNAPSSVILRLPDNSTKQYKVPKGQKFEVDGQQQDVFSLRKGMKISATVITETPEVEQQVARAVTGTAPAPAAAPAPETPPEVGALLIEEVAVPPPVAEQPAKSEVAKAQLPQTATNLPLVSMLAVLCFGALLLRFLLRKAI